jgi:proteic killer suppression protein
MDLPGYGLHPLKGRLERHWAVKIDRMWRVTFRSDDKDVILVDYHDYHEET